LWIAPHNASVYLASILQALSQLFYAETGGQIMADQVNSLANFTNQYQVSKTLRFELKPIGETADWIKKNNIIAVEENTLVGKDANKAKHYKYAKRMLDAMHRIFIEDALRLINNIELSQKLTEKFFELQAMDKLQVDKSLKDTFKNILDVAAKRWIEEYQQEMPSFWYADKAELEEKLAIETNNQRKKGFKSAINAVQKNINAPNKVLKNKNLEIMYSNEDALRLLEWKVRSGAVKVTFKELEQNDSDKYIPVIVLREYLRDFYKFSTYFSGFNENRQNVYDLSGEKSTSIINRTVNENLTFHFNNIEKWQTIKKSIDKYADLLNTKEYNWREKLEECEQKLGFKTEEVFTVESFVNFINQSGIDRYNEITGGRPEAGDKKKIQGINEFINLTRQQAGAKRNEFPPMQLLYKQILSKSDKTFINAFEKDSEMFDEIKDFHQKCFVDHEEDALPEVPAFAQNVIDYINEIKQEKENIFIAKDKLRCFSNELTGQWNTIDHRLLSEIGDNVFHKSKYFSLAQIENALEQEIDGVNFASENLKSEYRKHTGNIFLSFLTEKLEQLYLAQKKSWRELDSSGVLNLKELAANREKSGDKGFEQIALIKTFLDDANKLFGFVKDWQVKDSLPENANKAWYELLQGFTDHFPIIELYNKTRNHVTRKPYSTEKLKINFENSTLLDGWDRNKETDNYGILFERDGMYYLGIMTPESNGLFNYEIYDSDSTNKRQSKQKVQDAALARDSENAYRKINYKLLPGPNKMLPKVFFAESNKAIFSPSSEIIKIKDKKLYSKAEIEKHGIQNLHDYIDFCTQSLTIHPEWSKAFGFSEKSFRPSNAYNSVDEFYREVENQGYKITFDNIKASYIEEKVKTGELYLFQIYNKDFSSNKKSQGLDNLHTSYWKLLFSEDNLQNTVLKLNGQAEIFFRKASIKLSEEKKKTGHHYNELKGKFSYPIIKDRRFTEDKFFFHCPISMNFQAPSGPGRFNDKVREFLRNNPDVNIIGIDRGEKHLLYLSVINQNGEILEQFSLNEISTGFVPYGANEERRINYHAKLAEKEKNRDQAQKSWSTIENIKELKAGYLSQVVHKLAQMIIKYNAIVVLEDLNIGFKRGRFKVEKQVYQKFEKALIDKLNYLVFKDRKNSLEPGHYLNAYQLTNQFQSFEKLGKQSGILFYTTASYTSTTDPVTGFLKNVSARYENVGKSLEFWKSFDSIIYNPAKDRFEFTYTLGKVACKSTFKEKNEDKVTRKQWTVCSCVERSRYVNPNIPEDKKQKLDPETLGKLGQHELFCVTDKLKKLFDKKGIDYKTDTDIRKSLLEHVQKHDAELHRQCMYYFSAIMNMRGTDSSKTAGSDENDFIMSPVEPFFDSRNRHAVLPHNGDANGAYNIARKGICILRKIDNSEKSLTITKQDWQEYAQAPQVVKNQHSKL
jgi:hypothetical protein